MYTISPDSPTIAYDHISKVLTNRNVRCDDAKEVLTMLHFLLKNAAVNDRVVYIGTISGIQGHLPFLQEILQPWNLKWQVHAIANLKNNYESNSSCKTYEDLEQLKKSLDQVGMKDALVIFNLSTYLLPTNVHVDADGYANSKTQALHDLQMQWVRQMQPKAACVKMKPMYNVEKSKDKFQYLDGELFVQPFSSPNGTDLVLFVNQRSNKEYEMTKAYSHNGMEQSASYFNRFVRPHGFDIDCITYIAQMLASKMNEKVQGTNYGVHDFHTKICAFIQRSMKHSVSFKANIRE